MVESGIYTITNLRSGKVYIGSTVNFNHRWNRHRDDLQHNHHHNIFLQRSWNKHGEKVFNFGILEYLGNVDELHLAEQFWMDVYREEGKELYNIGEYVNCPWRGQKQSKEHIRKLSKVRRGSKRSEETRRKMSESAMGKVRSKETRRKMGDAKRGKNHPFYGKTQSKEHRRKNSEANMGHPVSLETRRRISKANKGRAGLVGEANGMFGRKHSEETRHKMSMASKARWTRVSYVLDCT